MTKKKAKKSRGFPLKPLVFLVLSLMVFFVAVDRQDLPPTIADKKIVVSYYEMREKTLNKKLPEKQVNKEKGYSDKERAKMETLINNKAEE